MDPKTRETVPGYVCVHVCVSVCLGGGRLRKQGVLDRLKTTFKAVFL